MKTFNKIVLPLFVIILFVSIMSTIAKNVWVGGLEKGDITNCLVVIDCQNDFITGALSNEEAQKKVPNIVNKIRRFNGGMIFVTMDTHDGYYLQTKEGKSLPVIHCIKGTPGWKINDSIQAAIDDAKLRGVEVVYVEKPTFGSSKLIEKMKARLCEGSVIDVCGFCTDICVISNVLLMKEAFYDISDITVDAKCCAGVTIESHEAALKTMKSCQIYVVD